MISHSNPNFYRNGSLFPGAKSYVPTTRISEGVSLGYGYLNEEFEISEITPAAAAIFRKPADEILGCSLDTLLEEVHSSARALDADPVALGEEYILRGADGEEYFIRLFIIPSSPQDSKKSIFIVEDITSLKKNEIVRQRLEARIEQGKEQWHRLFRNASHDMREPLRMVCTYLGLVKAEREMQLDETGREYLGFALEGAARLRRQTESLLRLLSFEFQDFNFSLISMDEALACAIQTHTKTISEKKAEIKTSALLPAWGNAGLMVDLFQALLDNALKFARRDSPPKLSISSCIDKGEIIYSITDNGEGVPYDKLEEIFDPFRRLNPRSLFMGEGLGLTMSRRIVQIHGGRIWAERASTGLSIHFSLPIGEARQ